MKKCNLCLQKKQLIKAHIIPRFFYNFLYPDNDRELPILMMKKSGYSKKRWIGSYDKEILCKDCDSKIGIYDSYAKEFFLEKEPIILEDPYAFILKDVNYKKIKLFLFSLLWRASITNLSEFSNIDTGPFEKKLHELLISEDAGDSNTFPIIITKFKEGRHAELARKTMLLPYKLRINGLNFYVFYFPKGYKIFFKVDQRDLPEELKNYIISCDDFIPIPCIGTFDEKPEFKLWIDLASKIPEKYKK